MGFFGQFGTFLSFAGNFVPGLGTVGAQLAAGVLTKLDPTQPDALIQLPDEYLDPYVEQGPLWGVPMSPIDTAHFAWTSPAYVAAHAEDPNLLSDIRGEAARRGSPFRLVGRWFVVEQNVGKGQLWGVRKFAGGGAPVFVLPKVIKLKEWNAVASQWIAQRNAIAGKDPFFRDIDTREWSDYWLDAWADESTTFDSLGYEGDSGLALYAIYTQARNWFRDRVSQQGKAAYAKWQALHASELKRYEETKARWIEWKKAREKQEAQAAAKAQFLANFQAIFDAISTSGEMTPEQIKWLVDNGLAQAAAQFEFAIAATVPMLQPSSPMIASSPTSSTSSGSNSFVSGAPAGAASGNKPAEAPGPSVALLAVAAGLVLLLVVAR